MAKFLHEFTPELLPISLNTACYSQPSLLIFGDSILKSDDSLQQSDPLALFYLHRSGIQELLFNIRIPHKIDYLDDASLIGDPSTIDKELKSFISYTQGN